MPAGPPRPRRSPPPWAALALLAVTAPTTTAATTTAAAPADVRPWVDQLAAPDPADRAGAEARLAAAGSPAVPALTAALDDPRPDVADRVRRTLRRVRLFAARGASDAALALADRYLSADTPAARAAAVAQLVDVRPLPAAVLTRLVLLEPDPAVRLQLLAAVGPAYRSAVPALVAEGDAAALDPLLERAAVAVPESGPADYAAQQFLTGRWDDAVARWRAELANGDDAARDRATAILCDLYRVAGRPREAVDLARPATDPGPLLLAALDADDWPAAADAAARLWPGPRSAPLRAALSQLAGRPADLTTEPDPDAAPLADDRLLLGQIDRGLDQITAADPAAAVRLRRARGEFDAALALADAHAQDPAVAQARDDLRRLLGDLPALPPAAVPDAPDPPDDPVWSKAVRDLTAGRPAAAAADLAAADSTEARYLRGYALTAAGDAAAGRPLLRAAALAPLADVAARRRLADRLAAAGLAADAAAQRALAGRVADPLAQADDAVVLAATTLVAATDAHDAPAAVAAATRVWLLSFWPGLRWRDPTAYLTAGADLHLARARLARSTNDWPGTVAEVAAARAALPLSAEPPLEWVPALDAHGDPAAADALFAAVYDPLDAQSRRHPRSPYLHNQAAWLAACCCRRLDAATAHARAAVALSPRDWQYLDTLAECRFRAGDRPAALALERQAAALPRADPAYTARQLARFARAPVPSTTRPAPAPD